MAAELYESEPCFRGELDGCLDLLRGEAATETLWSVTDGDAAATRKLARTDSAQPALFCVEFALARLWMHWGLEPDFLIGHSLGEYVAGCLSGVFSLEDGIRIVVARGRLMQSMPAGAMLALPLSEQDVVTHLSTQLDLAAVNGPEQVVISGPVLEIEALENRLAERGVSGRRLATSHAFHSRMMEPMLGPFEEVMRSVSLSAPRIPIISNTTGRPLSRQQALDPCYWSGHVRNPVLFAASVEFLVKQSCGVFLEVGPSNTLTRMTGRLTRDAALIASLPYPREESSDQEALSQAIGQLWSHGAGLDWQAYGEGRQVGRVALPGYAFAQERHWIDMPRQAPAESTPSGEVSTEERDTTQLDDWFHEPTWRRESGRPDDAWRPTNCLVFHDGDELLPLLRGALVQAGATVHCVQPGERYDALGDGRFTIRPDAPEDYAALVEQFGASPDLVLHLWSMSGEASPERALDLGFYSLLSLVQSLTEKFINPHGKWLLCSPTCYDVTGSEDGTPIHAALSGMAAVIPLEYPGLACRHVALDTGTARELAGQIQHELETTDAPGPVAWCAGERWTRSWTPVRLPEPTYPGAIKAHGTYLITGGLGSMGLAFAEYMSQQAPCQIVLTGRSAFPDRERPASRWVAFEGDGLLQLVEQFEGEAEQRLDLRTIDQLPDLAATIDELAASLVFHCVFGPLAGDQETWTREEWVARLSVLPRFERLLHCLLAILVEDGVVTEEGGKLRFSGEPPRLPDAVLHQMQQHHAPYAGLGVMLSHCARNYADVMCGRVNALEVLYPDGTNRLFAEHFAGLPAYTNDLVYQQAAANLVRETAQAEESRPLRVLEVGGGTGGLTQVVLEATTDVSVEYTFTDLGSSFVARAEQEAGKRGYRNMHFKVLNISRDPLEQGFAAGSYDMVIGYNVVHATPDIRDTLRHLSKVLVPGGLFCLVETVKPSRPDNMIWGLTEGWWLFGDTDLRTETPILTLDQWDKALQMEEFSGQTFPRSAAARDTTTAGLVVARSEPGKAGVPDPDDAEPGAGRSRQRLGAIEQRGTTVEYVRADAADADDMDRLRCHIRSTYGALDGIVHAAGELGQGFLRGKSREDVARTFAPKIHGAIALEGLLEEFEPSFLLLCSSMSSIAPIIGQADYAAANAFLDAYAPAANRRFNTRVGSITWGFWQELGMISKARGDLAQKQLITAQLERPGMHDAGVRVFARILENPFPPHVVVTPGELADPPAEHRAHHPWFDQIVRLSDDLVYLQGALSPESTWVLDDHEVLGKKVLPGTAYLEMVRAAAAEVLEFSSMELREIYFLQPLAVDRGETRELRTVLQRQAPGWDVTILSRPWPVQDDAWVEHTRGEIREATKDDPGHDAQPMTVDLAAIRNTCERESRASAQVLSERQAFEASMSAFGPHWHNLVQADFGAHQALGEFELPQGFLQELDELHLHPALLDNATGFLKVMQDSGSTVPFAYRTIRIFDRLPAHVYSHVRRLSGDDDGTSAYDITIADPDGRVLVDIEGYSMRPLHMESASSPVPGEGTPENVALALDRRGSLSTFFLGPELRRAPAVGQVEIEIKATGLNFIEVLHSLDMLPQVGTERFPYGLECAGIVRRSGPGAEEFRPGDEVLAFSNGCYRAFATVPAQAVARKPASLSMAQAATLPAAYMTAWHALTGPGRLLAGERLLIHSAAGGVGLAAVHVARLLGAEVLATAGTEEKRDYLRSIGVSHVCDSRKPGFGKQIMAATHDAGVDVVLNSLSEEFTSESLSVLARYGRFIELGKRAIFANASLEMRPFEGQLTFSAVDVGPDLPQFVTHWRDLMAHVHAGELPPLPLRTFRATDPSEGFEYMARGRHIGKIVFTFDTPEELMESAHRPVGIGRSFTAIVGHDTAPGESTTIRHVEAPKRETGPGIESDLLTNTEKGVARIWGDLLGAASVRRHDSFFELNGDSLLAAQVISQIHDKFGVKLPFSAIFDASTVSELAGEIDRSLHGDRPPPTDAGTEKGVI
jgi:acyl transferase domain-containing protein/SAM-dependent methyltransferase/acyl carrier protein